MKHKQSVWITGLFCLFLGAMALLTLLLQELIPERQIVDIKYAPQEHTNPNPDKRGIRVDVEATDADGTRFLVEMQREPQDFFYERAVYNASHCVIRQMEKGEDDYEFPAVYFIGLVDFPLHADPDRVLYRYSIFEDIDKELMTDSVHYIFLELPNCGKALSPEALEEIAASVGSDVPFCVRCGTALATGRGEKLETLPDMPACEFVICKPDFSISTPELFRRLDQCSARCHPDTAGLLAALEEGRLDQICRRMYNVFEDIDDRRMRTVKEIKGCLLDSGALGAVMTGTGSAVFGVFHPGTAPDQAVAALRREYGFCEKAVCVGRQT